MVTLLAVRDVARIPTTSGVGGLGPKTLLKKSHRALSEASPLGVAGQEQQLIISSSDEMAYTFTQMAPPLERTPFAVPAGALNVGTLIHIHTDLYQTTTTIRTTRNSSTYEIVGTRVIFPQTSGPAPEVPSILVLYVRNLDRGDSVINMTNSGARGEAFAAGFSARTTGIRWG